MTACTAACLRRAPSSGLGGRCAWLAAMRAGPGARVAAARPGGTGRPANNIRLFLSEWLIPTGPDSEVKFHTTRAVQAKWIADGWRIVRHSPFIYGLGWIHLYDDPPGGSQSGLLDLVGRPKPGYYAWKKG